MEAEGDSGKSVGEQSQVLPGPGITDSRGTKNPRRDQALLRELRKEEKELKDEERELVKEREQMESTDMPEHQRLDLSSPDCSSIKQSRNLLDRIERNAQRQLAVADEIRRLSEQMRTVKARSMQANEGEQKMETTALDEHGDAANGGEHKMETDAFNEHDAGGDAANGVEQKMETDALGEHDDDSDAADGGEQKMETAALDEHGVDGGAANGREQKMETAALDEHDVDGGGDEEQMDCDNSSMEEQVPRIDSKPTSEAEAEAATGLDTNELAIESNISVSVSDKSILKPAATNRGDDVVEKMDRGKSPEQLDIEAKKMAAEQEEFAQYVDAWDDKWGSNGFGLFQYMTTLSSMQCTHLIPGSTPRQYCQVAPSLQIFSIKLAEIGGGLQWPLPVYGVVAARDHVDHNRNLLFACYRSSCQILKEEDPFLTLIGPSRAIVCKESVDFEIQLKVRGTTESEDRALITGVCTYNRGDSTVCFTNCFCTAEFRLEVLQETVQATVLGVRVKDGSWPSGWGGRVACSVIDGEIDATPGEVELLVSRRSAMPVTSEGYLLLSRNVVSVDVNRRLNFLLEACLPSGDTIAQKELSFKPKLCNISQDSCELHGIKLEITVAWSSLVSEKQDISVQGCVGDEEQMDWDIASMEEQVPRIDSKLTSEVGPEAETESATGLDTSESANESNTSMFVSDKSILEPADSVATNTGYDVEKMDRGKSDEQLKIEAKKMAAEQKSFAMYVDAWEGWGNDGFGCFRDMTTVSSMQYTHLIPGSTPMHYGRVAPSLQIFSVKLAEIRGGLEWPLPVYGTVAARDHVDHNRNLLFARNRSECQILNEQDPFLTLTGPSRAIVSEESVVFEIQLKVRGRTKSQDKPLINGVCTYNRGEGPICFRNCFCTIELSLEVLRKTVQATILGIRVKEEGSWPKGFGGRVACSVIGPDARPEEVELLVSRYRPMPMTSEGYLLLSRNVVSADFCGSLNFVLEAYSDSGDKAAQGNVSFEPKFCNMSQETCKLTGGIELEITVAWSSLVSEKWDIWAQGCVF